MKLSDLLNERWVLPSTDSAGGLHVTEVFRNLQPAAACHHCLFNFDSAVQCASGPRAVSGHASLFCIVVRSPASIRKSVAGQVTASPLADRVDRVERSHDQLRDPAIYRLCPRDRYDLDKIPLPSALFHIVCLWPIASLR